MYGLVFKFRGTYCVSSTICKYLKLTESNQSYMHFFKHNTLYFISRNIKTDSSEDVEVTFQEEKSLENSNTRQSIREVFEYMQSKKELKSVLNYLPQRILKRKRALQEPLYTVDTEIAGYIANEILDNISQRNVPIFEINPGVGILSKQLLLGGVNCLCVFEPSYSFYQQIKMLQSYFPKQMHLYQQDLLSLSKLSFIDKQDGGSRVQKLFAKVSNGNWVDEPVMIITGNLPSLNFIKYLIHCHIHQTSIFSYGRAELYVTMSPRHYFYLTCGGKDGYFCYRSLSVFFQLIFQWHVLKKLPRKAFLPWDQKYSPKKWSKLTKIRSIDPEFLYLVKIVPHADFFERVVKAEQLYQFWYFIWHSMLSRKNRIIPQFEKWAPGCGPRLILRGMTIYTEFGELTPHQILSLFHDFTSWPEYPDSPFMTSMESMLMITEQRGDGLINVKERDGEDDGDGGVEGENVDEYQEGES